MYRQRAHVCKKRDKEEDCVVRKRGVEAYSAFNDRCKTKKVGEDGGRVR